MRLRFALAISLLLASSTASAGGLPPSETQAPRAERAPAAPAQPSPPVRGPRPDPHARLPAGDEAVEHWDLMAHFDSGHTLSLRFLITNAGPGDRTAVALGHLVAPDGTATEFRNGRREGRWTLSPDRRLLDIGSSVLDLSGATRRFEVDNDKREIEIAVEFAADDAALSAPAAPGGYHIDLLQLASPTRGRFRLAGMSEPRELTGRLTLTHTWSTGPEAATHWRRIDVTTLGAGPALFATRLARPGGEGWGWRAWKDGARIGSRLTSPAISIGQGEYPAPSRLELGSNPNDPITGRFALGPTRVQIDPLDALPGVLRMVYSFGGRPRHRWVEATPDVVLKSPQRDAVLRIEGPGAAALYFLDSRPPKQP